MILLCFFNFCSTSTGKHSYRHPTYSYKPLRQHIMYPSLYNTPFLHDDYLMGGNNGGKAMGYHNNRLVLY